MSDAPKIGIVIDTGQGGLRSITGAGRADIKTPVTLKPDIEGPHGRAWRVDLAALRRTLGLTEAEVREKDATLGIWIVEAPWAHPIWHSYAIFLVHLRPMADERATKLYFEGATHEFWLYAYEPDIDRRAVIEGKLAPSKGCMTPLNFAAQIAMDDDPQAIARVEDAIKDICDGKLSPDTDFRRQWDERFGNAMIKREWR